MSPYRFVEEKITTFAPLKDCIKSRSTAFVIAGLTRNLLVIKHYPYKIADQARNDRFFT